MTSATASSSGIASSGVGRHQSQRGQTQLCLLVVPDATEGARSRVGAVRTGRGQGRAWQSDRVSGGRRLQRPQSQSAGVAGRDTLGVAGRSQRHAGRESRVVTVRAIAFGNFCGGSASVRARSVPCTNSSPLPGGGGARRDLLVKAWDTLKMLVDAGEARMIDGRILPSAAGKMKDEDQGVR